MNEAGDSFYAFRERGLNDWLEQRNRDIRDDIEGEPEDHILNVNETEYVEHLVAKYRLDLPTIDFAGLSAEDCEKVIPHEQLQPWADDLHAGRSYRRNVLVYYLPFRGDADLLKWKPNGGRLWEHELTIVREDGEAKEYLCFEVICFHGMEKANEEAAEVIDNMKVQVECLAVDVGAYNDKLDEYARQALQARKQRLLDRRQKVAALNVPVRQPPDEESADETQTVVSAPGSNTISSDQDTGERRHGFFAVDVVGHSRLVAGTYRRADINTSLDALKQLVLREAEEKVLLTQDWHGDGGLFIYSGHQCHVRAFKAATAVLLQLRHFNAVDNQLDENIQVKVAVHTGFFELPRDIGDLHDVSINEVHELEQKADPNTIRVTRDVFRDLSDSDKGWLQEHGDYKGQPLFAGTQTAAEIAYAMPDIPIDANSLQELIRITDIGQECVDFGKASGLPECNWDRDADYDPNATIRLLCVLDALRIETVAAFVEAYKDLKSDAVTILREFADAQKTNDRKVYAIAQDVLTVVFYLGFSDRLPAEPTWKWPFYPETHTTLQGLRESRGSTADETD